MGDIIIPEDALPTEYRAILAQISNRISQLTPVVAKYNLQATNAKSAAKRKLAATKIIVKDRHGLSKHDQTLINAYAASDPEVVAADVAAEAAADVYVLGQAELDVLKDQAMSVKKMLGNQEAEMRNFGGRP